METVKSIARSEIGRKVVKTAVEVGKDVFASQGGIGSMRDSINMLQKPDPSVGTRIDQPGPLTRVPP